MKLHVIKNIDKGTFLGQKYEQGCRYSTYTQDSDTMEPVWDSLNNLTDNSMYNTDGRLCLFITKEAADEFIQKLQGKGNYVSISVMELE